MKIETEDRYYDAKRKIGELSDSLFLQGHNFGHAVLFAAVYSIVLTLATVLACRSSSSSNTAEWWPLLLCLLFVSTVTSGRVVLALYRLGIRPIGVYPVSLLGLGFCLVYWCFILGLPIYINLGVYYLAKSLFEAAGDQMANIVVGIFVGAYPVVQTLLLLYRIIKRRQLKAAIAEFADGCKSPVSIPASSLPTE